MIDLSEEDRDFNIAATNDEEIPILCSGADEAVVGKRRSGLQAGKRRRRDGVDNSALKISGRCIAPRRPSFLHTFLL